MKLLPYIPLVALVLLSACVATTPQSITDVPLTRVTAIGDDGLFAADPAGRMVAICNNGLSLHDMESNTRNALSSEEPIALAWSPDGLELAAAYSHADYETRLLIYSADGEVLRETLLPVALTQLVWSARGDLLVAGLKLKIYSFGGNLRQTLHRIVGEDVEETLLSDSTLRPSLVTNLAPGLGRLQPVAFSPSGDELVFLFLHDPPEFPPYLQLVYRNWQSNHERLFQKIALQEVDLTWKPSGDSVDIIAGDGSVSVELWPSAGAVADPSLLVAFHFSGGRLYRGTDLLADWGDGAQLQLLSDGKFLLAVNKSLYLGEGLQNVNQPVYNEKAWNLRHWRFRGLITQAEYLELLKEKDR